MGFKGSKLKRRDAPKNDQSAKHYPPNRQQQGNEQDKSWQNNTTESNHKAVQRTDNTRTSTLELSALTPKLKIVIARPAEESTDRKVDFRRVPTLWTRMYVLDQLAKMAIALKPLGLFDNIWHTEDTDLANKITKSEFSLTQAKSRQKNVKL